MSTTIELPPHEMWEIADGVICEKQAEIDRLNAELARCASTRLTPAEREELRYLVARYEELLPTLGCGDSSCRFVKSSGMMTNGGCRCFKDLPNQRWRPTERFVLAARNALPLIARLLGDG